MFPQARTYGTYTLRRYDEFFATCSRALCAHIYGSDGSPESINSMVSGEWADPSVSLTFQSQASSGVFFHSCCKMQCQNEYRKGRKAAFFQLNWKGVDILSYSSDRYQKQIAV